MRAAACLGSRFRGDDAVGPLVADRLRAAGAVLLDCDDEPTRLLDAWAGLDLVVIVDAVRTGAEVGTVHRVDAGEGPLARELGLASTHAFSIADTLELGRAIGRAPRRVVVVGVEGAAFGLGDPLTPEVETVLAGVAETLALAHALDRLPPRVIVYGVEGSQFGATTEVSPAVAAAVDSVVADVLLELR